MLTRRAFLRGYWPSPAGSHEVSARGAPGRKSPKLIAVEARSGNAETSTEPIADAHTLVLVFLRGGADTLNMVVPYFEDEYYRRRPTLGIAAPKLAGAEASTADSSIKLDDRFAFHPKMSALTPAFREGRLCVVNAVGSDNDTGSHFDAQDQLERGESLDHRLSGGWLGRYLRAAGAGAGLAGVAIGETIPESMRGAPAITALRSIDQVKLPGRTHDRDAILRGLDALYAHEADALGASGRDTLRLLARVESLQSVPYTPDAGAAYGDDAFSAGLREIARLTKAGVGLRAVCIDLDGWDTHFIQGGASGLQASLIERFAKGMAAFDADTRSVRERVSVVVMTEFGRRLYENGSLGTDHGRGFALFAMGAGVRGGRVLGDWPGLSEFSITQPPGIPMSPGPGGLAVKHDYREVLAEIVRGVSGDRVARETFPGLRATPTLGIMDRERARSG